MTRTITVQDTTPPLVTLVGSSLITLTVGSPFTDPGASWSDAVDGTGQLLSATTGSVNTSQSGTTLLTYSYTDTHNNTGSTTRTVNVIPLPDTTPPVITLVGSNPVTIYQGTTYIDAGALWTDTFDGSGVMSFTSGSVNPSIIGTYVLEYRKTDGAGNISPIMTRIVNVIPVTPSIIVNNGPGGS